MKLESFEAFRRRRERPPLGQESPTQTNVACPRCGSQVCEDRSLILTSDPPQVRVFCENQDGCGWCGYVCA